MKKRYLFLLIAICSGAYWCAANFVLFTKKEVFGVQKGWEHKMYEGNALGPNSDIIAWIEKNKFNRVRLQYATEPANILTYRLSTIADAGLFPCLEWHINLQIDLNKANRDLGDVSLYAVSECVDQYK